MNEKIEKMKGKNEEDEQLCIPEYVNTRINDYISILVHIKVDNAWRELKRCYRTETETELYKDRRHILAYIRYYFPLNYVAIKWILITNQEKGTEIIPEKGGVINVLDYGAGPGTASMAIYDFLEDAEEVGLYKNTKIMLSFFEKTEDFSICYKKMLRKHKILDRGQIREHIEHVHEVRSDCYDIIIASYVLNELSESERKDSLYTILRGLKKGGYLIIIESAYEKNRYVWDFLKKERVQRNFKIVDASGPLCSQNCEQYKDKCYKMSVKRKKLRTPEIMTEDMRDFFVEKKGGIVRWVHAILRKEENNVFVDPSKVEEYGGKGNFVLCGWVIKKQNKKAANITLCNGLGPCNLAFWKERGVYEQVHDVSEGDMLWIEGDYSGSSFDNLPSVYVSRIIEHIKKI